MSWPGDITEYKTQEDSILKSLSVDTSMGGIAMSLDLAERYRAFCLRTKDCQKTETDIKMGVIGVLGLANHLLQTRILGQMLNKPLPKLVVAPSNPTISDLLKPLGCINETYLSKLRHGCFNKYHSLLKQDDTTDFEIKMVEGSDCDFEYNTKYTGALKQALNEACYELMCNEFVPSHKLCVSPKVDGNLQGDAFAAGFNPGNNNFDEEEDRIRIGDLLEELEDEKQIIIDPDDIDRMKMWVGSQMAREERRKKIKRPRDEDNSRIYKNEDRARIAYHIQEGYTKLKAGKLRKTR